MARPPRLTAYWFWMGLGLCGAVLFLALKPSTGDPAPFPGFDKVMHASVFAVLAAWFAALHASAAWRLASALALVAFGSAIEILQHFTGRDPSFWDLVADAVGIAAGMLLLRLFAAGIMGYVEDRVRTAVD